MCGNELREYTLLELVVVFRGTRGFVLLQSSCAVGRWQGTVLPVPGGDWTREQACAPPPVPCPQQQGL